MKCRKLIKPPKILKMLLIINHKEMLFFFKVEWKKKSYIAVGLLIGNGEIVKN